MGLDFSCVEKIEFSKLFFSNRIVSFYLFFHSETHVLYMNEISSPRGGPVVVGGEGL